MKEREATHANHLSSEISSAVHAAHTAIDDVAARVVGVLGLRAAIDRLRYAMLLEAMRLARGSRHAAAKTLGVNRRAVQRTLASIIPEHVIGVRFSDELHAEASEQAF